MGIDYEFEIYNSDGKMIAHRFLNDFRYAEIEINEYECNTLFNTIMFVKGEIKRITGLRKINIDTLKEEVITDIKRARNHAEFLKAIKYYVHDLDDVSVNSDLENRQKELLEEFLKWLCAFDYKTCTGKFMIT